MYEFNRSIDLDYLYCFLFCFFFSEINVVEYAKEEIDYIQNEMEDERTGL